MKSTPKKRLRERSGLFSLFLLISLLLHLLVGLLLQEQKLIPEPQSKPEQTPVALQERNNWLELDQKPLEKSVEPPKNATHLAKANQQVERETAPKADDSRDQLTAKSENAQAAPHRTQVQQPTPKPRPRQPEAPPLQTEADGTQNPPGEKLAEELQIPIKLPNLTRLSPSTLARLDRQERQRSKDRPEIELKDDEVWLDLRQDDKLISFFRRFSDRIEAVWNYPVEASSQGVEGTLLIKIVVNKKGELIDALPVESSGSDILDYEAITAVYRAAPFGNLPSSFTHEQLKIYAHFQYSLSRRMIYGRP